MDQCQVIGHDIRPISLKWWAHRDSNPSAANIDRAEFARSFVSENPRVMVLCYFNTSHRSCTEMKESEAYNAIMAACWRQ